MMQEYFLKLLGSFGFLEYLKHDPGIADSDVTPEYCAKRNWVIGSPATVAERLEQIYEEVGGFGAILVFGFDYAEKPEAWHHSMRLLAEEVMPKVQHLKPKTAGSAAAEAFKVARAASDDRARAGESQSAAAGS
jgi:hypothetical protein